VDTEKQREEKGRGGAVEWVPKQPLTNREWLPGELLSGSNVEGLIQNIGLVHAGLLQSYDTSHW